MMNKKTATIAGIALFFLAGCISVPKQYRGKYEERKGRYALTLSGSKATFSGMDMVVESKVRQATFKELMKPQMAMYVASDGKKDNLLQAYWLIPDLASKQEAEGFIWYDAKVFLGEFDTTLAEKASNWNVTYCTQGTLLLDTASKTWQIGCSASVKKLTFDRTQRF